MKEQTITLRKNVAAIQMVHEPNGRLRMGVCMQLLQGSDLEICGDGFSERTVQVRAHGDRYMVLLERILGDTPR